MIQSICNFYKMRIIFIDHARKQIEERKLSKLTIINSVRKPSFIKKQKDGRYKLIKIFKQEGKLFFTSFYSRENV